MTTMGLLIGGNGPAVADRSTLARRASKRAIDLTIGCLALVVLSPVLALAALAVLVLDGRPVLFRQVRVGRHERPFTMLKFRTMVPDAEQRLPDLQARNERSGPLFKVHDDPRVTPVGRILRLTSIDELPQLFHVLSGKMSLVGPRPALPSEVEQFDAEHRGRHAVRPGITGCWQAAANDHASFERYRALDLYYLHHWGPALDARLLAATAVQLLRRLLHAAHERLVAGLPAAGTAEHPTLALATMPGATTMLGATGDASDRIAGPTPSFDDDTPVPCAS